MHGIIFVTWEKYLAHRFGNSVLQAYRNAIGETVATSPLTSRVYDDTMLLAGVGAANHITAVPTDQLLREFGRYFITNGLTRYLCAYLLSQVQSARDLLLAMRHAHEQMSRLPDSLTPPLFEYIILPERPSELILIYDSPRKLCPVLLGAIEGAAERYHEHVEITEQTCMNRGEGVCWFELRFSAFSSKQTEQPEKMERYLKQRQFAQFLLALLPNEEGVTLAELQAILQTRGTKKELTRPALLLEALRHLHHAGLVATSANQPGDTLVDRRYWRVSQAKPRQSRGGLPQS
jgi:hypothetical protein